MIENTIEQTEAAELRTRIAALEGTVAELTLALQAEAAERAALPKLLVPGVAEAQRGLNMLEENFTLTMQAVDARVTGLASRVRDAGGPSELTETFVEFVHDYLAYQRTFAESFCALCNRVRELEEFRLREMERQIKLLVMFETLGDGLCQLRDRIERGGL